MPIIATLWGIFGVCALLTYAITRLSSRALLAIESGLTAPQWIFLSFFALFMLYSEGYRGFQKKFSPRTAARVHYLYHHTTLLRTFLAPLFCMGYFYATKKTKITVYCLTLGIIGLITLVSLLPFPWRGIIDFGVALGLSYGILSFLFLTGKVFTCKKHDLNPETPTK